MPDHNYPPGEFAGKTGETVMDLVLEPPDGGAGYDDIWKLSRTTKCGFFTVTVKAGEQRENALDLNNGSSSNLLSGLKLDAGKQGAILVKGGSCNNLFNSVVITKPGGHSDIMIGGYSAQSRAASVGNIFISVSRSDGKPVRVAWTFTRAEKPKFTNSNVRYQYGWSLLRTIAMEWKYLWS